MGSKYGITAMDPFGGSAVLHSLPSGLEMNTMFRWSSGGSDFLLIGSSVGLHFVALENGLPVMGTLTESDLGPIEEISQLDTGSGSLDLMVFGNYSAWTVTMSLSDDGAVLSTPAPNEAMNEILSHAEAHVRDVVHVPMFGRGPLLLVGTDAGLIAWNTTDGSNSIGDPLSLIHI